MNYYNKYKKYKQLYTNYRKGGTNSDTERSEDLQEILSKHTNNNYFFKDAVLNLSPNYIEPGMWKTTFKDINKQDINQVIEWFNINEVKINHLQKNLAYPPEPRDSYLVGMVYEPSKYHELTNRVYISTNIVKYDKTNMPIDNSYHSYGNINKVSEFNITKNIYTVLDNLYKLSSKELLDKDPFYVSIIDRVFYDSEGNHTYRLIGAVGDSFRAYDADVEILDSIDFTDQEIHGLWYDISNQESSASLPDTPSGIFESRLHHHFI